MAITFSDEEMSGDEMVALSGFLARVKDGEIPNVEALDGFLTALVISPDLIKPSEFTPVIIRGAKEDDDLVFQNADEAETFFGIIMNHWNRINRAYRSGDIYIPLLFEDASGEVRGNDWAWGFLRATALVAADWANAADDGNHGPPIVPIWSLAYENHPDPALRSNAAPFSKVERATLIAAMTAGAKHLYDHFHRGAFDGCPCGSGKLAESCCEAVTLH